VSNACGLQAARAGFGPLSPDLVAAIVMGHSRALKRFNLLGWSFVVLLTVLVEASVRSFDLHDSVAAPSSAFRALGENLSSGTLPGEIGTTLESYAQGLALAVAVGVTLGLVVGSSRTLRDASSFVIEFLRPIPAVALIPLALLAFGLDTPMRRFVIAFAAVWPILINTIYGVRSGDRFLHDVARTAGLSSAGRLVRVTLPAALPSIATGFRVSASLALLVCVTAEWVAGTGGLGHYMYEQQNALRLPEMYAAVILVGALGYLINLALRSAERRLVFWVGEERMAVR
jgi:ABC-type nitrate/sulfonate/bicarbonate transport system permease component